MQRGNKFQNLDGYRENRKKELYLPHEDTEKQGHFLFKPK